MLEHNQWLWLSQLDTMCRWSEASGWWRV